MSILIEPIQGGLKNEKLKVKKREPIPIPDGLFELPTVAAFIAHKGSGKTNAACLLAHKYQSFGSINTIYVISPTYESNPEFEVLDIDPSNIYQNISEVVSAIVEIEQKIIQAAEDYTIYLKYKKIYAKWRKIQDNWKHPDRAIAQLTHLDLLTLEENDYRPPPDIPKPRPLILMDDLSHSAIYSGGKENPFNNLALRHRHIGGVGYGVTLFMMVQTFKTGIPRALRQGAVTQFFVWKTNDDSNIKEMYDAISNSCTFDQFITMYKMATEESHHFLTVDPYNSNPKKRFRKDFDCFLIPADENPAENKLKRKHIT